MLAADILTLGMAADDVRRSALGTVVTYLRVHDVGPGTGNGREGIRPVIEGWNWVVPDAAGEVRLWATPLDFADALDAVRRMRAAAGTRRVVAFSWMDLVSRGWATAPYLRQLVEAGLEDVAELPVDRVENLTGAIESLLSAGATPQRLTVAHPLGEDRVDIIHRVQGAFAAFTALRRFSPLPRTAPVDKPTTGYDDVRMVALARLALPDRSIEVHWQQYGPKLAQVALMFGADHLDAVSALDDTALGPRRTALEDVLRNIRAAGFEPQEYRPT
jgi:hypothetical protein